MFFGFKKIKHRKLLVTGCARSGTLYTTLVLRSLGLDIRHERPIWPNGRMGRDGMVSWYMAVDDPKPPHGPCAINYAFDHTIHQVRHPLNVIPSVAQFILRYPIVYRFILRNLPKIRDDNEVNMPEKKRLLLEASRYWIYWNDFAEKKADQLIRLEYLEDSLPALCEYLQVSYRHNAIATISHNINHRQCYVKSEQPWILTWSDLSLLNHDLCENVRVQAARYGYYD